MPDCRPAPLPECLERLGNIEAAHKDIRNDVRALRVAMLGNGTPRDSFASRVAVLEAERKANWQWVTLAVAVGAILVAILK